jgi:hypothetical protein
VRGKRNRSGGWPRIIAFRKDYGGFIDQYKRKYAAIRDSGERVIIDCVCNSFCTLVLGIVPLNRICATPRGSLGFHTAHFDTAYTFGIKVTNYRASADMLPTTRRQ